LKAISKKEFNGFNIPRTGSEEMMPWEEIEFYKNDDFIAEITKDKIDHDFGFVVFKNKNGKLEFFNNVTSMKTKNDAIEKLKKILSS
jgi:hypothetical protein